MTHYTEILNVFLTTPRLSMMYDAFFKQGGFVYGPRHTTNPSPLRIFWVQKITCRKLLNFLKSSLTIQNYSSPISETSERTLSSGYTPRFWFKRVGKFLISKIMHFLAIFRYLQISFTIKSSSVDQVLTKILQIDQKLTFDTFHILNQGRISKIEKRYLMVQTPPKMAFFGREGGLEL